MGASILMACDFCGLVGVTGGTLRGKKLDPIVRLIEVIDQGGVCRGHWTKV